MCNNLMSNRAATNDTRATTPKDKIFTRWETFLTTSLKRIYRVARHLASGISV